MMCMILKTVCSKGQQDSDGHRSNVSALCRHTRDGKFELPGKGKYVMIGVIVSLWLDKEIGFISRGSQRLH